MCGCIFPDVGLEGAIPAGRSSSFSESAKLFMEFGLYLLTSGSEKLYLVLIDLLLTDQPEQVTTASVSEFVLT